MNMRTSDVIVSDLQDQAYGLGNQEHQQANHPHPVNIENMERTLTTIEKHVKEMWQAIARMKEARV
jgi:uncharacterized membrane protein